MGRGLRNFLNMNKHILKDCIHPDLNNTILGEAERATRKLLDILDYIGAESMDPLV